MFFGHRTKLFYFFVGLFSLGLFFAVRSPSVSSPVYPTPLVDKMFSRAELQKMYDRVRLHAPSGDAQVELNFVRVCVATFSPMTLQEMKEELESALDFVPSDLSMKNSREYTKEDYVMNVGDRCP